MLPAGGDGSAARASNTASTQARCRASSGPSNSTDTADDAAGLRRIGPAYRCDSGGRTRGRRREPGHGFRQARGEDWAMRPAVGLELARRRATARRRARSGRRGSPARRLRAASRAMAAHPGRARGLEQRLLPVGAADLELADGHDAGVGPRRFGPRVDGSRGGCRRGNGHAPEDRISSQLEVKPGANDTWRHDGRRHHRRAGPTQRRGDVGAAVLRGSKGLIHADRTEAGHRRYLRSALRRIAFIVFAQRVGLSLDEVGGGAGQAAPEPRPRRRRLEPPGRRVVGPDRRADRRAATAESRPDRLHRMRLPVA